MERKRVLVVNTTDMGYTGISSVIMNYFHKTYNDVQYDFVLCGKTEGDSADRLREFGCNIFSPPCSRVRKPLTYYFWLKGVMGRDAYDAIHVHGNSGTMFLEIHAAKTQGLAVRIAHCHSTSCKYKVAHRILKPFLNKELTCALACSDVAGKWLYTGKYEVLPNGVDVDKFAFSQRIRDEYRQKLGIRNKFVIGHVAGMNVEKNHAFLLDVVAMLAKERQDICLLLIGDGARRGEIEAFVEKHQLKDHVQLLGKRADVAKLYQCMDVFVLPSLFEGLPVTLVEAQCAGLRCIVSDRVTDQVNVTKNIAYIGIKEQDKALWKDALLHIAHSAADVRREDYAEILRASAFSIDRNGEKLLGIYT